MWVSSRMAQVRGFAVMDILARAQELEAAGRDIVHMEVGEPDFPTPAPIVAAGQAALAAGLTRYTPATGLPQLREAIAQWYADQHGLQIDPQRIAVTPGASGALQLALAVCTAPGQRMLVTDPGYPCNANLLHMLGVEPTILNLLAAEGYLPNPEVFAEALAQADGAMLASPGNPTGAVIPGSLLAALAATAEQLQRPLIVDELYHGLCYDAPAESVLRFGESAFVVNSFSKYFGMTGWRLGWLVCPPEAVGAVARAAQNLFLAPSTLAQHAALAAFTEPAQCIMLERVAAFRQRRDFLVNELSSITGGQLQKPNGAFYLYVNITRLGDNAAALAEKLLEQGGVAVTPGRDFGQREATSMLRFAYTTSQARMQEAVVRMRQFLNSGADIAGG